MFTSDTGTVAASPDAARQRVPFHRTPRIQFARVTAVILAVLAAASVTSGCTSTADSSPTTGTYMQSAVAVGRSTAVRDVRAAAVRHVLDDLEKVVASGGRHAVLLYTGNGSRHQVLVDVEIPPPDTADPVARAAQVKKIREGTQALTEQALGLTKPSPQVAEMLRAAYRPGSDPAGMLGASFERARETTYSKKAVDLIDDGLQNAEGIDLAALIDSRSPKALAELLRPLVGDGAGIDVVFSGLGGTQYPSRQSRSRDIALKKTWTLVCRAARASSCSASTD